MPSRALSQSLLAAAVVVLVLLVRVRVRVGLVLHLNGMLRIEHFSLNSASSIIDLHLLPRQSRP
jgi:hypothetical protein